jgi:hypothetical protein
MKPESSNSQSGTSAGWLANSDDTYIEGSEGIESAKVVSKMKRL